MTPEDLAKSGTESGHQRALFMWSGQQLPTWPELLWMYAIPNGGGRSAAQGNTLKAEGVKGGVSDVCLPIARKGYHGFYIEMKKPGDPTVKPKIAPGKESEDQKKFGAFLHEQGYLYRCCFTWEEARDSIIWYMG